MKQSSSRDMAEWKDYIIYPYRSSFFIFMSLGSPKRCIQAAVLHPARSWSRTVFIAPHGVRSLVTHIAMPVPSVKAEVSAEVGGQRNVEALHRVSRDLRSEQLGSRLSSL
jgi:hypothetical protein